MKKIVFASSLVKLAGAAADCNKICTSASNKTAIPGSKNCKHYCKCSGPGQGERVPAGAGSIFSALIKDVVDAPGNDTDCPGRPDLAEIKKLALIEEEAGDEIQKEIDEQEGVDPEMLDLEEKIGRDIGKKMIEFAATEEDDENDTEEETEKELVDILTDSIIEDARQKLQPNAYTILKKDV